MLGVNNALGGRQAACNIRSLLSPFFCQPTLQPKVQRYPVPGIILPGVAKEARMCAINDAPSERQYRWQIPRFKAPFSKARCDCPNILTYVDGMDLCIQSASRKRFAHLALESLREVITRGGEQSKHSLMQNLSQLQSLLPSVPRLDRLSTEISYI